LFLGRIHPKKGIDLLIEAFSRVAKLHPEIDLVVAGPDQVGWQRKLQKRASDLGIASRVHWAGMLTDDTKWGAYRAAEAFILPSHQENFGVVVAEALASGTPSLITDKVNIWRDVTQCGGGLADKDDLAGIQRLMTRFLALDEQQRRQMRVLARTCFEQHFDVRTISQGLVELISEAVRARQPRPPHTAQMKILQIIASIDPVSGGPYEVVRNTSAAVVAAGHQVQIVCLDSPTADYVRDFPVKAIGLGPSILRYRYNPLFVRWIKANAPNFDFAIIHGIWNYASIGGWRALHRGKTPYVLFTHGMLAPWFRRSYPLKHWLKQIYWLVAEGRVLRDAESVFFACEEEKRLAKGAFFGYSYNERVVGLGTADVPNDPQVQIPAFHAILPALQGRRFLLFLGRIHPIKGCDLLLQAFAQIAASNPDLDLVMAGPDQVGLQSSLIAQAAALGIACRVHWPGMLVRDAKLGAFRAAEAFVLPSHQENFGVVVAEAMACGIPVLITDKVNIWREVQASGGGLIGNDDLAGITSLLNRFLSLDDATRRAMGRDARQGFLDHFTAETAAAELLRAIAEIEEKLHIKGLR
jgi:glycosyltransferase involved in cell wall biosynthesis